MVQKTTEVADFRQFRDAVEEANEVLTNGGFRNPLTPGRYAGKLSVCTKEQYRAMTLFLKQNSAFSRFMSYQIALLIHDDGVTIGGYPVPGKVKKPTAKQALYTDVDVEIIVGHSSYRFAQENDCIDGLFHYLFSQMGIDDNGNVEFYRLGAIVNVATISLYGIEWNQALHSHLTVNRQLDLFDKFKED